LVDVDWVGQNTDKAGLDASVADEVAGHGVGLAEDAVSAAVKQTVKQACVERQVAKAEGGGYCAVLADKDLNGVREHRAQNQDEEVEMKHAGEDDLRSDSANELEQWERRGANTRGRQAVNGDRSGQVGRLQTGLRDQPKMEVVFLRREILRQKRADFFGSAAAEVGDEKKDSGTVLGDWLYERLTIRFRKVLLCFPSLTMPCMKVVHCFWLIEAEKIETAGMRNWIPRPQTRAFSFSDRGGALAGLVFTQSCMANSGEPQGRSGWFGGSACEAHASLEGHSTPTRTPQDQPAG
jgi:hypothetical protein